jgi:hypothetical protein
VDLGGCFIEDYGVIALGQGCPLLEVITLTCCEYIVDAARSALGKGCPLLLYNRSRCRCSGTRMSCA